ncbi:EamA/RhaT family transporter [Novosphingobium sp. JCM 18896]|uniref:EamA/RhaT family transporter n=1 Tax=Novosphingobium sp. JCM 18896 TaxID=2989731 RepID=UPI002221EB48|nr:EamA/RhaT family transporter [Novosphingobium sp. JCM 18896]MCW1427956.1 EamA/RhaT family transporter [Novosphingobium sp. JCM 18896]
MPSPLLWVPVTVAAATAQVFRNGAQANLTAKIGTLGATQVRFIFGLPFAMLFLTTALVIAGASLPAVGAASLGWCALGALAQIAATALMLQVMRERAFGVAYAYIKTEPVLVAVMGVVLLHDVLGALSWIAIGVVTAGVLLASTKPSDARLLLKEGRLIFLGTLGGGLFGLSAIAFRAAIEALGVGDFVINSLSMLVLSLAIQSALLGLYLALRQREAFLGSLREWRVSLGAGFLGAAASSGWFVAFSLTAAANVRTLALIEMPLAALVSRRISGRALAANEWCGTGVILAGLALLLYAHAA